MDILMKRKVAINRVGKAIKTLYEKGYIKLVNPITKEENLPYEKWLELIKKENKN